MSLGEQPVFMTEGAFSIVNPKVRCWCAPSLVRLDERMARYAERAIAQVCDTNIAIRQGLNDLADDDTFTAVHREEVLDDFALGEGACAAHGGVGLVVHGVCVAALV
jgi:hypothetical protein